MEIETNENKEVFCCSNTQPIYFIKYLMMCSICIIVLIFSILRIILSPCDDNVISYSIITMIIGVFVPTPTIKK